MVNSTVIEVIFEQYMEIHEKIVENEMEYNEAIKEDIDIIECEELIFNNEKYTAKQEVLLKLAQKFGVRKEQWNEMKNNYHSNKVVM